MVFHNRLPAPVRSIQVAPESDEVQMEPGVLPSHSTAASLVPSEELVMLFQPRFLPSQPCAHVQVPAPLEYRPR